VVSRKYKTQKHTLRGSGLITEALASYWDLLTKVDDIEVDNGLGNTDAKLSG